MLYKTITLELLKEHTTLYERLRQARSLDSTLTRLATELRDRHLALIAGSDDPLVKSQAMEVAVDELQQRLAGGSSDSEA